MTLHVEVPIDPKYRDGYTISKCYCSLTKAGLENKGFTWLRRMACLVEGCEHCSSGRYLECQDPSGKCGPWVKCRLVQTASCRKRRPAANSNGLGAQITVSISGFHFYFQFLSSA